MATINGTTGSDNLRGVEGVADTLLGGAGNDILNGARATPLVASSSAAGVQGNGSSSSSGAALSANGRYVVFANSSNNLVGGDPQFVFDVFRKDLATGAIVRVSTALDGGPGDSFGSYNVAVSNDGRYVVFESDSTNLVAGDTNGATDVFRKDLATGALVRVGPAAGSRFAVPTTDARAISPEVSADGRYVAFWSTAADLVPGDTNGTVDLFRKDLVTGAVVRVNTAGDGSQGGAGDLATDRRAMTMTADGRYVVFESAAANLVPGDTNGRVDVFRKDLATGAIVRVSTAADGSQRTGNNPFGNPDAGLAVSADGRYVVFQSAFPDLVLPAAAAFGVQHLYRKDLVTGAVVRVNTAADGTVGNDIAAGPADVSADGRYVVFSSAATNLVPGTGNGGFNIYVKDMVSGALTRVSVPAAGTQPGVFQTSTGPSISADGRYVAFESNAPNLVSVDANGVLMDTFRVPNPFLGEDILRGGPGDDQYVLRRRDTVVELAGEGTDTVRTFVAHHTLEANVENLVYQGGEAFIGVGNELDNTLVGGGFNDRLDGRAGVDRLIGGAGNDTYVVDNTLDVVSEAGPAGDVDTVLASVTRTLGKNQENLTLLGTAGIAGTGNALANEITGNAAANVLEGRAGADRLSGGAGADVLSGGPDADLLLGGLGGDRFDFNAPGDTAVATPDRVGDFSAAQGDRIDLRDIDASTLAAGNQAFAFIGAGAFSGLSGQLRYAGGLLEGDVDGNRAADFRIQLTGVPALDASAILL